MALYIPHSIFHLEQILYVRPETFGPYYVCRWVRVYVCVCRTATCEQSEYIKDLSRAD